MTSLKPRSAKSSLSLAAALVVAAFSCSPGAALAQDLGSYGNVWEIKEPDAIDQMKGKLSRMEKSGELRKMWEKHRDSQLAQIEEPAALPGISKASQPRVWSFDPTFTFGEDVTDHLGNVIVRAGTAVNPLRYTPLTKSLIFIDARDPAQVAFAKARSDANPRDKVILVGGSFLKLNRAWKRPTYFDQRGHLTTRMGIKRVPAVVTQKGLVLEIQEFVVGGPTAGK